MLHVAKDHRRNLKTRFLASSNFTEWKDAATLLSELQSFLTRDFTLDLHADEHVEVGVEVGEDMGEATLVFVAVRNLTPQETFDQTSLALRNAYAEAEGANRRVKELEGELEALNDAHRPPK